MGIVEGRKMGMHALAATSPCARERVGIALTPIFLEVAVGWPLTMGGTARDARAAARGPPRA